MDIPSPEGPKQFLDGSAMGTHRSTGSANFSHSRCRNRAVLKAPADYLGFRGAIHLWSGNPAEHQKSIACKRPAPRKVLSADADLVLGIDFGAIAE